MMDGLPRRDSTERRQPSPSGSPWRLLIIGVVWTLFAYAVDWPRRGSMDPHATVALSGWIICGLVWALGWRRRQHRTWSEIARLDAELDRMPWFPRDEPASAVPAGAPGAPAADAGRGRSAFREGDSVRVARVPALGAPPSPRAPAPRVDDPGVIVQVRERSPGAITYVVMGTDPSAAEAWWGEFTADDLARG